MDSELSQGSVLGLRTVDGLTAGPFSVQRFTRGDGEVVWRYAQHRLVLPLTGSSSRNVTVQFEGGRTKEFVWGDGLGFYPAQTQTRIVTTAATSLHLLWSPDKATFTDFAPLLPFEDPLIAPAVHAIADELQSAHPDRLYVESLANAVVIKMMRRFTPKTVPLPRRSGLSDDRLRRLVEYIDAQLAEQLTLEALASIACLSPFHLSRSFRQATGIGLHRYIVQRRIERARRLVIETNLPMAEIAARVGFETPAAFATRFRRETGTSPSKLRTTR